MKKLSLLFLAVIAIVLTSCQTRITDFTIISTKNVDLSNIDTYERQKERVTGEDNMYLILIIPTKFQISVKEAVDNAIESVPGCVALVDGVVYQKQLFVGLGGYNRFIVEGTPLVDPKLADNSTLGKYNVAKFDENGKVVEVTQITESEFNQLKD